jgi:hypothetical protein
MFVTRVHWFPFDLLLSKQISRQAHCSVLKVLPALLKPTDRDGQEHNDSAVPLIPEH